MCKKIFFILLIIKTSILLSLNSDISRPNKPHPMLLAAATPPAAPALPDFSKTELPTARSANETEESEQNLSLEEQLKTKRQTLRKNLKRPVPLIIKKEEEEEESSPAEEKSEAPRGKSGSLNLTEIFERKFDGLSVQKPSTPSTPSTPLTPWTSRLEECDMQEIKKAADQGEAAIERELHRMAKELAFNALQKAKRLLQEEKETPEEKATREEKAAREEKARIEKARTDQDVFTQKLAVQRKMAGFGNDDEDNENDNWD